MGFAWACPNLETNTEHPNWLGLQKCAAFAAISAATVSQCSIFIIGRRMLDQLPGTTPSCSLKVRTLTPLRRLRRFLRGLTAYQVSTVRRAPRVRLGIEKLESRLALSTGGFDLSFSADGKASLDFGGNNDTAEAVAVQSDGKIVAVGRTQVGATDFNFAIARFNRDGTPDTSFNGTGKVTVAFDLGGNNSDQATAVAIDSLGRIVVGGSATSTANDFDFAVCRLTSAGLLDATFDGDGRQTVAFNLGQQNHDQVNALALQADGKIVLAGQVQRVTAGDTDFGVVRLNADGSPDTQFSGDGKAQVFFDAGGSNADTASAVAIQPDGMIVVAGTAATAADFEFAVTIGFTRSAGLHRGAQSIRRQTRLGLGVTGARRCIFFERLGHIDRGVSRSTFGRNRTRRKTSVFLESRSRVNLEFSYSKVDSSND